MAADTTQHESVRLLGEALQKHLGITPAADLDALFSGKPVDQQDHGTAQYLIGDDASATGIRVHLHHDLTPAMLVHDPTLLTLGVVEVVPPATAAGLPADIDRIFDRAAYLRQLCLFEAESVDEFAYVVELVLLFTREHTTSEALERTVSRLRELARETGYLKTLGVSLLSQEPDGTYTPENLRRAFPWVLAYTRRWFNSGNIKSHAAKDPAAGAWEVTLGNYRNTRQREYRFEGAGPADARGPSVHVLHGFNGSGKTTFTEALELLLMKQIERMGDPERIDYYEIVRHHPRRLTSGVIAPSPPEPTMVALTMKANGAPAVSASVTISERRAVMGEPSANVAAAPQDSITRTGLADSKPFETAASFRLDQPFMDDLIRSDESKRATRFLKAFFPGDRSTFDALTKANDAVAAALEVLPSSVRDALKESAVSNKPMSSSFESVRNEPATWTAGILPTLAPCLTLTEAQLDMLGKLETSIFSIVSRWRHEPTSFTNVTEELKKLDSAFEALRPRLPEITRHLEAASQFFTDFASWQTTKRIDRGAEFERTLNQWLQLQALADLVSKYHDVMSTLAQARDAGWQIPTEYEEVFKDVRGDAPRLDFLKAQRDAIGLARDHARTAVHAWGVEPTADALTSSAPAPPPRGHIPPSEVRSLNEVCRWLPSLDSESSPLLGDLVVSVLDTGVPATRGRCSIGVPNGLALAAAEAEMLLQAIRVIEPPGYSAAAIHTRLGKAQDAIAAVRAQRKEVENSFFSRLAEGDGDSRLLADALHELLALFKPAPWAYQEILFRARLRAAEGGGNTETLGLVSDNLPAELRLNTAEMNSFTLALFLLCAPSLENPLRLLVLDDPLQNMDEMTVSSLARGLGRLFRIYPTGWRIVALFHAEEDLHRVRAEVPCAVYRLPWVNPTGAKEDPIGPQTDESTWKRPAQRLTSFIAARPVS